MAIELKKKKKKHQWHLDWFPSSRSFTAQLYLTPGTQSPGKMKGRFCIQNRQRTLFIFSPGSGIGGICNNLLNCLNFTW